MECVVHHGECKSCGQMVAKLGNEVSDADRLKRLWDLGCELSPHMSGNFSFTLSFKDDRVSLSDGYHSGLWTGATLSQAIDSAEEWTRMQHAKSVAQYRKDLDEAMLAQRKVEGALVNK